MLPRFRALISAPDRIHRITHFAYGKILFNLPVFVRKFLYKGEQHFCPICGNSIRHFLRLYRPYHLWCPICGSLQRHRLLWLFYNSQYFQFPLYQHHMLHIAPEPALETRFKKIPNMIYLSADLDISKAMVKMDVSNVQFPENSFDILQCSHVLEHVVDDQKALNEFWRILRPNGIAILLVPISGRLTYEDPGIISPDQREKAFGQFDHVRSYGMDFIERVAKARFVVKTVTPFDLVDNQELLRFGLDAGDIIFHCKKPS
jgi:SAM-dependent methyltransferase